MVQETRLRSFIDIEDLSVLVYIFPACLYSLIFLVGRLGERSRKERVRGGLVVASVCLDLLTAANNAAAAHTAEGQEEKAKLAAFAAFSILHALVAPCVEQAMVESSFWDGKDLFAALVYAVAELGEQVVLMTTIGAFHPTLAAVIACFLSEFVLVSGVPPHIPSNEAGTVTRYMCVLQVNYCLVVACAAFADVRNLLLIVPEVPLETAILLLSETMSGGAGVEVEVGEEMDEA